MARKRFVSPEFFTHGELYDAEVKTGLPLRLAYAGLWTACDRRGLFWWKPREMKLSILPYDPVDFEAVLWALESTGFIEVYLVDGKRVGRVPSFDRWQSFHKNEVPSDVPEPSNGRRETSKDRREPSPSVAVAVAVTGTTAVAATTSTRVRTAAKASGASPQPAAKYPHFPHADRQAAYATWTAKRGPVDFDRMVRALGPCWPPPDATDRPSGAALLRALDTYCVVITSGRSAPFASIEKAAELLIPIAKTQAIDDPIARYDAAFLAVHGHAPKVAA